MSFTNFCCRSGGSNLNAGTRKGDTTEPGTSPILEYAGGTFVRSTRVFTVASGDPAADGIEVGDWVSVYTVGSTEAGYIGEVSARDSTTITIHSTRNTASTTNVSESANNATLRMGGAFEGPTGTVQFPFNRAFGACRVGTNTPRLNLKNDQTYSMTAALTLVSQGGNQSSVRVEGYQTSYGDNGFATIQGPASGTSFVLFTNAAGWSQIVNMNFDRNGSTGSANLVSGPGNLGHYRRCTFSRGRGYGVSNPGHLLQCEVYQNTGGGVLAGELTRIHRAMIRGNGVVGVRMNNGTYTVITNSIVAQNSGPGISVATGSGAAGAHVLLCDVYGNTSYGVVAQLSGGAVYAIVENCNIFSNGAQGIYNNEVGSSSQAVWSTNNCFGSGTAANTGGNTLGNVEELNSITYTANELPWIDASAGDYRLKSTATAIDAEGNGSFLQTESGYGGSVGYPAIGSCQPAANVSGGGGGGRLVGRSLLIGNRR